MKNSKTIHDLESIPKSTIYSKYGGSLNRLFKSKSLNYLIYKLKNPKKYVFDEFIPSQKKEEVRNKYFMKVHKDIFSTIDLESYNNNKEVKKLNINKHMKRGRSNYIVHKSRRPPDLIDPFKYNPNYNAISKKIPSVHMVLNDKEIKELQKIREKQKSQNIKRKLILMKEPKKNNGEIKIIPKGKSRNPKSFITSISESKNQKNNSTEKIELPPIYNAPEQKDRAMTIENNYRNNHAIRFSKYSPRNLIFNDKERFNKLSYLKPYNYLSNKNNVVDFKKMAYRKDKDLIYSSSLSVPTFNNYNPKFNLVEKKAVQVCFSPHKEKKFTKQYLLRKLWGSYNVDSDYKLINNNKLIDYKDINID